MDWIVDPVTDAMAPALAGLLAPPVTDGRSVPGQATGNAPLVLAPDALGSRGAAGGPGATPLTPVVGGSGLLGALQALLASEKLLEQAFGELAVDVVRALIIDAGVHPIDFTVGVFKGIYLELFDMIGGLVKLLLAAAEWETSLAAGAEATGRGLAEIVLNDVLAPDPPLPVDVEASESLAKVRSALRTLDQLGQAAGAALNAARAHPAEAESLVILLLTSAFQGLAQALAGNGPLRAKVMQQMQSPTSAGELIGGVLVNVLIGIATDGAGEVAEAAEVGRGLPLLARKAEELGELKALVQAADALTGDSTQLSPEVGAVLTEIRAALRAKQMKFMPALNSESAEVMKSATDAVNLAKEALVLSRDRVATRTVTLRGTVGTSKSRLARLARRFNERGKLVVILQAAANESLTAAEMASVNEALAETVLEAAHLVDARLLPNFSAAEKAALSWSTDEDMSAVLATAYEHRGSVGSLTKLPDLSTPAGMVPALPPDLQEFTTITTTFRRRLVRVDSAGIPLRGELPLGPESITITPTMTGRQVIEACRSVWQDKQFSLPGGIANQDMMAEFDRLLALLTRAGL